MSERVRRMRRGLERGGKAHLALSIERSKSEQTDGHTEPPYDLLLPQELAELRAMRYLERSPLENHKQTFPKHFPTCLL